MAVKLHRCSLLWLKAGFHPCWRVQRALDEAGVEYEVVTHSPLRPRRDDVEELSGQRVLPVLELDDGSIVREESKDMAERIREGKLKDKKGGLGSLFSRGD